MPPQQPYLPPTQPPQQNYDFIFNPEKPKRQLGGNFFNGSPKSLIIMIGALVGVIIIIFIAYQAMKPAGIGPQLTQLAQSQAEITRVAQLDSDDFTSQSSKNLAASVAAVMTSQQNGLLGLLAKNGIKLSSKDLAESANPTTDQNLDLADQNGDFDSTFNEIITGELKSYGGQLASIHKQAKGSALRNLIYDDYQDVGLLLSQAK